MDKNIRLGFVPTMGALHEGHISLVNKAMTECDAVASSIFVNPTQFSKGEDLDKYPRTMEKDVSMLSAAGVEFVFAPGSTDELYPSSGSLCHVEPAAFSRICEGVARPEFFRGVATIVCKLFNIVQPTVAYFGQKDISQCILVKRMVQDLNMPVEIRVCETMREVDGLAMSSRNTYLSPDERKVANILYRALCAGKAACNNNSSAGGSGFVSRDVISAAVTDVLKTEPMVSKIEYISIASHRDMKELDSVKADTTGAVISSAIRLGNVRLIDNLLVGASENYIYSQAEQSL
jgi:pantoate--beta-alanine ligase